MRHVFYPALVSSVGDVRTLELPDFDLAFHIAPEADAYMCALQAAGTMIEDLRKRALDVPLPSPLSKFQDRTPAPDILFQVPLSLQREYVRIGMNMHPMLLQQVDQVALARGMTRSAFICAAAAREIAAVEIAA